MNDDTTLHANDLTQLSSREQLSALMDGGLPPDETRFLLRRLQHDASLAECWERWRLTGEVMRGLAPAQRLPADFAGRVANALHVGEVASRQVASTRAPAWWRWGTGAAVAASLAVAALVLRPPAADVAVTPATMAASPAGPATPATGATPQDSVGASPQAQVLPAAVALAAAARPLRARGSQPGTSGIRTQAPSVRSVVADPHQLAAAEAMPLLAQPDIVTRPWPRSVLPQYASDGLSVGFGSRVVGQQSHNPFQAQVVVANLQADSNAAVQSPARADAPEAEPATGTQSRP